MTTSTSPLLTPTHPRAGRATALAAVGGAGAMALVGGATAASGLLVAAPLFTVQALRYAAAALLLGVVVAVQRAVSRRGRRRHPVRLVRPVGAEWAWLAGVALTGLLLFNVALVRGARHAEPAVFAVAVASVPLLLVLLGPVLDGSRSGRSGAGPGPRVTRRTWTAAALVTGGAVLVVGLGRSDLEGFAWALVVLACEAAFTLLAVPVLGRHGPWGVSVHTTWMAALAYAVIGLAVEGPTAVQGLDAVQVGAVVYLAVGVTAVAFVLWYGAVGRLGAGRAGLLTGVAPVAAAVGGVALGGPLPGAGVWVGILVVAVGLAVGLAAATPSAGPRPASR